MLFHLRCAFVLFVALTGVSVLSAAAPPPGVDGAHVKVLLHRLDANRFLTRQKADDALRALGRAVLPFLKEERERTQSPEVRFRLDRMVHDLTIDERIPGLVQMLSTSESHFHEQAEWALRQAGPDVVPLLRKELRPTLDAAGRQRLEKIIAELSSR